MVASNPVEATAIDTRRTHRGRSAGRRSQMEEQTRIVAYADSTEKDEIEQAAASAGDSVSSWAIKALLREARRQNEERPRKRK